MNEITKRLMELDPTLELHNEGYWDKPLDPAMPGYTSFNDAGIETETGEFLYGFARVLKPQRILETGTHIGVGAAYMGMALKDNGEGHLDTVEFIPELHKQAKDRIFRLDLDKIVECYLMDVANFDILPKNQIGIDEGHIEPVYKLILLDTEPQTRFAEVLQFFPYLEPGGFMFIHDLNRHMAQVGQNPDHPNEPLWPWGPIPKAMSALVTSGQLRPFHFDTPRGLTGFYKTHPGDYAW